MMLPTNNPNRNFIFFALLLFAILPNFSFGMGQIQVENAAVGDKILIITLDDSVQTPDLSKLRVEGYEIENAVFVDDKSIDSLKLDSDYVDLTAPGNGEAIEYNSSSGLLILDLPPKSLPKVGNIFGDTALGGVFCKVVSIESQSSIGLINRRWILRTVPAELGEAVSEGDISFSSKLDLNQSLANRFQELNENGLGEDSSLSTGHLSYSIKQAQILFQPTVTGRLRVHQGKVEIFQFQLAGISEVTANISGSTIGQGSFELDDEIPGNRSSLISLGSGLFIKVSRENILHMESTAKSKIFSAEGSYRILNSLKANLNFSEGEWRPLAENKLTLAEKSVREIIGNGEMKISIQPKIQMLLQGIQGPIFTFDPYLHFTQNQPDSSGLANKQMSMGSNIYMDAKTNFGGASESHRFLLFNHEQTIFSPPREGLVQIKDLDSNRIALQCQTFPLADYYFIQQKLENGEWENVLNKVSNSPKFYKPKIRLSSLKPNSPYRFRLIGVNSMGQGPAFPPDGIAYFNSGLRHIPAIPILFNPDSAAMLADTALFLTWRGEVNATFNTNETGNVKTNYSVFLEEQIGSESNPLSLNASSPIASGISDTSLFISGLKKGRTYRWKVIAYCGPEKSESLIRNFSIAAIKDTVLENSLNAIKEKNNEKEKIKDLEKNHGLQGFAVLPKGTFRRQDGENIIVGPFLLDKTEVTQFDFKKVTGENPSYRYFDSLPVERVTWEEAKNYCREIGGRLPTEAEWEYAARAGSSNEYAWGEANAKDYAWFRENADNHTQKVGQKKPNAWGLYDMAGNVFEWVNDWYGEYSTANIDHPPGPASGTAKVIRGASWYSEAANLASNARYSNRPGFRNFKIGFRCAKDVE